MGSVRKQHLNGAGGGTCLGWRAQWAGSLHKRQQARQACERGGRGVHAAICLKEGGGSISNFRSKEGQPQHGEVIMRWSSTRVMKDSWRQGSFHGCASSREERPGGALLHLYYSRGGAFQTPPLWSKLQNCGEIFQEVFFYSISRISY